MPNKSLDASGGSVFLNLLGAAQGVLIRAAASTQTLGVLIIVMINLFLTAFLIIGSPQSAQMIAKTGSMLPTIPIDSTLVVDSTSYSRRNPKRFDIIVVRRDFRNPGESAPNYNKIVIRVVGLPGEHVSIRRGHIYIDGRRVTEPFQTVPCPRGGDEALQCREMSPTLVPPGGYFLLGDNRPNSADSRIWSPQSVARADVLGKVVKIIPPATPNKSLDASGGSVFLN